MPVLNGRSAIAAITIPKKYKSSKVFGQPNPIIKFTTVIVPDPEYVNKCFNSYYVYYKFFVLISLLHNF